MLQAVTLVLPYPPSTNVCWRCTRVRERCQVLLSRRGRSYRAQVGEAIGSLGLATLKGALSVSVHVYPPDRRKRDLDNCIKPILDALQHHRVILDDYQVGHLSLMRHDPEPGRARAEVSLLEVEVEVET